MKKFLQSKTAAMVLGLACFSGAITSQATVIDVATYRLGESDPGVAAGNTGNASTKDNSGNGFDLTSRIGSPTYSANHAAGVGSLSLSFNGSSYYAGPTVTNDTENVGISLFVNPFDVIATQGIAINGSGCCSGFGLFVENGVYYGLYGGVTVVDIGPAIAGVWAQIALVNDGGLTTGYLNYVAAPAGFIGDPHPANGPVCCSPPLNMTIGSDGFHHFNGLIDDVRVFTFNPGEFQVADLVPVPEPISLALFGAGLAALGFVRRKQAI